MPLKDRLFVFLLSAFLLSSPLYAQRSGKVITSFGLPLETENTGNLQGPNLFASLGYAFKLTDAPSFFIQPELSYIKSSLSPSSYGYTFDNELINLGSKIVFRQALADKAYIELFSGLYYTHMGYTCNCFGATYKKANALGYSFGLRPVVKLSRKAELFFDMRYMGFSERLRSPEMDLAPPIEVFFDNVQVAFYIFSVGGSITL